MPRVEHQKVLLLGIMPGMTMEQMSELRTQVQAEFPEYHIRLLGGLLSAFEFTTTVETIDKIPGAYL